MRWTEAVTNEFDFRWTVRALRRRGLLPDWMRHYNPALVDSLHATLIKLGGHELAQRLLPGWRPSRLLTSPLVKHGMSYGLEAQKLPPPPAAAAPLPPTPPRPPALAARQSEGAWVAERLGSPLPLRVRRTRADVEALLDAPASATPQELSRLALERGLLLSGKAAGGFGDEIAIDEAARAALEAANYQALQKELRTRAPLRPDAAMAALGSPTRRGSAALPGPLPGMAAQARRPAQLDPLVEEDEEEDEDDDD